MTGSGSASRSAFPRPSDFATAPESAELLALVTELAKLPLPGRDGERSPAAAERARREIESHLPIVPSPRAEEVALEDGPALRLFRPEGPVRGALLHMHGGGWVTGRAAMNDAANERLCDRHGLVVASVDYRRAPEHPFPAGPDDCEAAARWLVGEAEALGARPDRLFVSGESAGAHLAALTALRMRDRHGFRFRAANLVYGIFDLAGLPSERAFDADPVLVDSRAMRWFVDCFVPDARRRRDSAVSPLYADLRGFGPSLLTVGSVDPLLDHSVLMATRLAAAGNPVELEVAAGAPHGYHGYPTPEGRRARRRIDAFLADWLAA